MNDFPRLSLRYLYLAALLAVLAGCSGSRPESGLTGSRGLAPSAALENRLGRANVRLTLLPPNVHGRLVDRTMEPRYITIHSTENPGGTAEMHARYLLDSGKVSKNNPRFGRSGWVTWHFTVDDQEAVEHLLTTEQGDHADYGGPGDRESIGIEICEFRDPTRQQAAIDRAARLAGILANYYHIPESRIVPHMHWPRWDYQYGKPCPHILLEHDRNAPGGWRLGAKWEAFLAEVRRNR